MKHVFTGVAVVSLALCPTATLAKNDLPSNVTTKPYGSGKNLVIDTIDYSFVTPRPIEFSRVKMCIATNLTNNEVLLSDNAGSFAGYAGTYNRGGNTETVQGGSIFKYVDDASKSLVARGSVSRQGGLGGIIGLSIRFDLEMSLETASVRMKMLHVEAAMKNTGSVANNGYYPIGVWTGSMYKKNIQALDGLAAQLKACITS